jgi:hypothetical protein
MSCPDPRTDAEDRRFLVPQPLDGLVVEVDMGHFDICRQRLGIDGETVVLRSDVHFPGAQILHRLVPTAMAELELEGLRPAGQAEDLVAEADAEDGDARHHDPPGRLDGVGAGLGVAGAVGEEDSIGLQGQHIFCRSSRRDDGNIAALSAQLAQDVVLDAEVVGDDVEARRQL